MSVESRHTLELKRCLWEVKDVKRKEVAGKGLTFRDTVMRRRLDYSSVRLHLIQRKKKSEIN